MHRCYTNQTAYLGVPLPVGAKRGRDIIFGVEESDEFIRKVLLFNEQNMRLNDVATTLRVSIVTIHRSIKSGKVMGQQLPKPVKLHNVLWWDRQAVMRCRNRLYGGDI